MHKKTIRVWLLERKQPDGSDLLEPLLRQWLVQVGCTHWMVGVHSPEIDLRQPYRMAPPEVLVVTAEDLAACLWFDEVEKRETSLVVAGRPTDHLLQLAQQHPLQWIPQHPTAETLGLAVVNAWTAWQRQQGYQNQLEQVQKRLEDRIVIERAKEIMAHKFGIPESQAYRRLRLQSRRQRRQIRDVAQAIIDMQDLLLPDGGGLEDISSTTPDGKPEQPVL